MPEILFIASHREYQKTLRSAGYNVHYLEYEDLDKLNTLIKKDFFRADIVILRIKKGEDIPELTSVVRQQTELSDIPLVLLGNDLDPYQLIDEKIFSLPAIKGSLFVAILKRLLEFGGYSFGKQTTESDVEQIIRSIEFPPEYYQSGITILGYFANILRRKNLSDNVKVSIEQRTLQ